jgi:hypothetical protein
LIDVFDCGFQAVSRRSAEDFIIINERSLQKGFEIAEVGNIVSGNEGPGVSLLPSTSRASHTVYKNADSRWEVEVDNMSHSGDIKSSRGDIRNDEQFRIAVPEVTELLLTSDLVERSINVRCAVACSAK